MKMTIEEAETAVATAKTFLECQAIDARVARGLAIIFAVEVIMKNLREAPANVQAPLIEKIVYVLFALYPTTGSVKH